MNFVLQENQDLLIKCVSQDLGFSSGKPIAACLIYRCLLHWRSFEVERTGVFDRIIQTIGSAIEVMNCACFFDVTPFFLENYTSQFDCLVYSDY
jgi:myosin-5